MFSSLVLKTKTGNLVVRECSPSTSEGAGSNLGPALHVGKLVVTCCMMPGVVYSSQSYQLVCTGSSTYKLPQSRYDPGC